MASSGPMSLLSETVRIRILVVLTLLEFSAFGTGFATLAFMRRTSLQLKVFIIDLVSDYLIGIQDHHLFLCVLIFENFPKN